MDNSDKKEFATLYYAMGEYYEKTVSTNLLAMFFTDLTQYTIEEVKEGARLHRSDTKHGSFFPKPPDIIRHMQTGKISTEEKAELAWAQINQQLRSKGAYGNLELDDKQALAALKSFVSWKEFCRMDISRVTWAKKEFISMYSTYENTPLEMLPSSLPGLIELQDHKEDNAKSVKNILSGIKQHQLNAKNKKLIK